MGSRGKIGSLPYKIRMEVNQRLRDGATGPELIAWLSDLPAVKALLNKRFNGSPINEENVSNYRQGPYLQWLVQQERVDATRQLSEFSMQLAQAGGASMTDGAAAIMGGKILTALESADEDELGGVIKALTNLRLADAKMISAKTQKAALDLKDRQIDLAEAKFQRTTAELFLEWYEDQEARKVAEGSADKTVKMDKLVELMFGKRPEGV